MKNRPTHLTQKQRSKNYFLFKQVTKLFDVQRSNINKAYPKLREEDIPILKFPN